MNLSLMNTKTDWRWHYHIPLNHRLVEPSLSSTNHLVQISKHECGIHYQPKRAKQEWVLPEFSAYTVRNFSAS